MFTRYPSGANSAPYGAFDTPADGATGLASNVPVTGWALDDIAVDKVQIWRAPVGSEPAASNGLVYVADALFIVDARPDVEGAFSTTPMNYRAGWGYLMLTNFLPSISGPSGNGVYKLYAIAIDKEGNRTTLGSKTITVDNAHSTKPFGSLDTPAMGETISGAAYVNFGWALTPQPGMIPVDGSTLQVGIDGVNLGKPVYNQFRSDIATAFPGYANSGGAVGYYYLDTTKLSNGIHNIGWLVYDNLGRGDGIGSRFFYVSNSGSGVAAQPRNPAIPEAVLLSSTAPRREGPHFRYAGAPDRLSTDVSYRIGYSIDAPFTTATVDSASMSRRIDVDEMDRVEIHLPSNMSNGLWTGALLTNGSSRPLPVGSTFDDENGVFFWQLGPGFVGDFTFAFQTDAADGSVSSVEVTVSVHPRTIRQN